MNKKVRAGFVGFGEVNTPKEFILERCSDAAKSLEAAGLVLVKTKPVCDDPAGGEAERAVRELTDGDFDVLVLCVAGWIPSWAVIKVAEAFKHKPMVLWGLGGWKEGNRFVSTADQAGTTALRKPMEDMGFVFKYVATCRGKEPDAGAVANYARAARAAAHLKTARIGMAGYRDMGLYGTLYDGVSLKVAIGPEIEHFDLLEIAQAMEKVRPSQVSVLAASVRKRWKFEKQPQPGTLESSVRLFLAIQSKIKERGYRAFSFCDVDGIKRLLKFAPAGSMTLLHDEMDVCSIPENDSLGAVTQLMVKFLTGQAAAYLEFYEFLEDGVLMGVPDYVPADIVDGPVTVLPAAFGGFGEGLLNVSKLKTGRVTLCRLSHAGGRYCLHLVTGTARTPAPWEEAGWARPAPQLPSLEIVFDTPVQDFAGKVLSQHYIISYGDNRSGIADLCSILGVEVL